MIKSAANQLPLNFRWASTELPMSYYWPSNQNDSKLQLNIFCWLSSDLYIKKTCIKIFIKNSIWLTLSNYWAFIKLPLIFQWASNELPLIFQWAFTELPLTFQWASTELPLTFRWASTELPLIFQWASTELPLTFQWEVSLAPTDLPVSHYWAHIWSFYFNEVIWNLHIYTILLCCLYYYQLTLNTHTKNMCSPTTNLPVLKY